MCSKATKFPTAAVDKETAPLVAVITPSLFYARLASTAMHPSSTSSNCPRTISSIFKSPDALEETLKANETLQLSPFSAPWPDCSASLQGMDGNKVRDRNNTLVARIRIRCNYSFPFAHSLKNKNEKYFQSKYFTANIGSRLAPLVHSIPSKRLWTPWTRSTPPTVLREYSPMTLNSNKLNAPPADSPKRACRSM